ncbi:hypothetical protein J23TS9_26700 [Paenibacillus sp. J23TS9]|nr:hypothetical protein J23TS9_26700 [Paenibacillus sp. J23TS9]
MLWVCKYLRRKSSGVWCEAGLDARFILRLKYELCEAGHTAHTLIQLSTKRMEYQKGDESSEQSQKGDYSGSGPGHTLSAGNQGDA